MVCPADLLRLAFLSQLFVAEVGVRVKLFLKQQIADKTNHKKTQCES